MERAPAVPGSPGTDGYRHHPQLERFRTVPDPVASVGGYLAAVADEATARGYLFDRSRIDRLPPATDTTSGGAAFDRSATTAPIPVTDGQLAHEWAHLQAKLAVRRPQAAERWEGVTTPDPHPSFVVVPGSVASWERVSVGCAASSARAPRPRPAAG